jgi:hypothetical protein
MAFAVEIARSKKRYFDCSNKNKQDLYRALTSREILDMILEQGLNYILSDKETFHNTSGFEKLQKDKKA